MPFSSLMFFERRTQSSIKHRRLRYLVLFALRTLLFALLALAFAHPYLRRTLLPASRSDEVTVFAIDNSLSMRAAGLLDQAKTLAKSEVASLRPGHRAQVLAFASRVEVLSEVTGDQPTLDAAIDAHRALRRPHLLRRAFTLASLHRAIAPPAAARAALFRHAAERHARQLQRPAPERRRPVGAASAGFEQTPNFTVENVVAPRRVYSGAKTRVLATIAGFGTPASTRNVSLVLNGRVIESKAVAVPESGRATVEFTSLEVPYGRNRGAVKIDSADALADDDTSTSPSSGPTRAMPSSSTTRPTPATCCTSKRRSKPRASRRSPWTRRLRIKPPTLRLPSTPSW